MEVAHVLAGEAAFVAATIDSVLAAVAGGSEPAEHWWGTLGREHDRRRSVLERRMLAAAEEARLLAAAARRLTPTDP